MQNVHSYDRKPDSETILSENRLVPYEQWEGCLCSPPDAPPWFADWITTAPSAGSTRRRGKGSGSCSGSASGGDPIDAEKIIAQGVPAGRRNVNLHKLACSRYRRHGTDDRGNALVLAELRQAWQAGDTGGFDWGEVLTLAGSARGYIAGQQVAERAMFDAFMGRSA
jgi:hypothetical protein